VEPKALSLIEKKLKNADPVLFRNALLKFKEPRAGKLMFLRRVWKKGKGTAIICIFLMPLRLLPRKHRIGLIQRSREIFQRSNEELNKQLPRAKKEIQKIFIETAMELNDTGIEQSILLLERCRNVDIGEKITKDFIENPTKETLLKYWNFVKHSRDLEIKFARLLRRKADVQDRIVECDKKMTKLDKRDLEDFQRAIMIDVAMSYVEKKALFIGTPIEIMLKSGKIKNRIRGFFLLTPVLRADAELVEDEQNQLLEWFRNYKE
jgi:hypothetical protein